MRGVRRSVRIAITGGVAVVATVSIALVAAHQGLITHPLTVAASAGTTATTTSAGTTATTTSAGTTATTTSAAQPCAPDTPTNLIPTCAVGPKIEFPSQPVAGAALISQTAAEIIAQHLGVPAPSNGPTPQVTNAAMLSYTAGAQAIGEQLDPTVNALTPVWLVTVHGLFGSYSPPAGAPASALKNPEVYTVIIDAVNGEPIDACDGCSGTF